MFGRTIAGIVAAALVLLGCSGADSSKPSSSSSSSPGVEEEDKKPESSAEKPPVSKPKGAYLIVNGGEQQCSMPLDEKEEDVAFIFPAAKRDAPDGHVWAVSAFFTKDCPVHYMLEVYGEDHVAYPQIGDVRGNARVTLIGDKDETFSSKEQDAKLTAGPKNGARANLQARATLASNSGKLLDVTIEVVF